MNYSIDWDGPGERDEVRDLVPCTDCSCSGWEDKVHRPLLGPFAMPACGFCKRCNGRGWASPLTTVEADNADT